MQSEKQESDKKVTRDQVLKIWGALQCLSPMSAREGTMGEVPGATVNCNHSPNGLQKPEQSASGGGGSSAKKKTNARPAGRPCCEALWDRNLCHPPTEQNMVAHAP
jgi:hypothetical protein